MSNEIECMYDSSDSQSETFTPRKKPERRKVTQSTRRRSTLLYLEKYGLDQPNWYTSPDDKNSQEEEEEEEEEIMVESPVSIDHRSEEEEEEEEVELSNTPATSICDHHVQHRPTLFRNSVQTTVSQKRPGRFIKPEKSSFISPSLQINVLTPTEFKNVQQLFDIYANKTYIEGYLYKKNHLNSNGSTCESNWDMVYIELSGPVLTLWDAQKPADQDVMPQYINIMDSTVTPLDDKKSFSLNSAGTNRFLFKSLNPSSLINWILAIRLSCFECARLQELYTRAFIQRPQFHPMISIRHKSRSGYVQVRFPGATGWKRFWAVVANHKKLFRKQNNSKILFYESKKAKYPTMTLDNVVQAYTVYPESPKLIKMATLFKIEGALYNNQQLVSASSSALVMASDTNDLVAWLLSIFDVFKLYGRPAQFLEDPKNQNSLNFGDDRHTDNLFLRLQDVADKVNVDLSSTLLLNKKEFASILHAKMTSITPITRSHKSAPVLSNKQRTMASDISESDQEDSDSDDDDSKVEVNTNISSETSEASPITVSSDKIFKDACSISTSSSTSTRPPVSEKPFYAQQKSMSTNHVNQLQHTSWPMYASTGSILLKDHYEPPPRTPVHDTSMYKSPSSYYAASIGSPTTDDDDDDDTPIGETFPSLPFKQPRNKGRMMFEQQQRQYMMMQQQYMQQKGVMMMPVIDTRMMMYDPRMHYNTPKPTTRQRRRGSSVAGSVYSDSQYIINTRKL